MEAVRLGEALSKESGNVWVKVMGDRAVLFVGKSPIATLPCNEPTVTVVTSGNLSIDILTREVGCNGKQVYLTKTQFDILQVLLESKQRVVTRNELVKLFSRANSSPNVVDTHVSTIRMKLRVGSWDGTIRTIRGAGFRILP